MKTAGRTAMAFVLGLALVSSIISCASNRSETKGKGFLGDYYKDLGPGPGVGPGALVKPGVNFGQYKKVILEHVIFFFDEGSENKAIDTSELDQLAKNFDLALVNALQEGNYPIVTEPGPDVIRCDSPLRTLRRASRA